MDLQQRLSLGWRTDLIFARFGGLVEERGDCVVVRTPDNPLFYWGNCLILPAPPRDDGLAHWLARFDEEIGCHTRESGHVAIGFDATQAHEPLLSWQRAGFEIFETVTLRLLPMQLLGGRRELPQGYEFSVIDLQDAAQRRSVVDLHCASNAADAMGFEPAGYRRHRERQMDRYAAMQSAGLGKWLGVRRADELVADCGLFRDGGLGRFQHVTTHPNWRRRGLCTAMVEAACRFGFEHQRLEQLVMCADPDEVAIGIYESLGFMRASRHWGAQRRPSRDQRPA
ncbi:GNAT family N-acetyltransferase [Pelomonas sp. SE-A7]|uniref:GNAT family N-acetyltransferase n=1 Tax=Pelomonas sp. SE-A7 TaxID=3054953 RepID=UPI00259CD03D|nr:GNAT family N-acetyltransferase [Pelomonas sp. SE-A7]MDM4767466.1 GNAT family N-acetyltransferase [Pelomonas sp. SE-A7]